MLQFWGEKSTSFQRKRLNQNFYLTLPNYVQFSQTLCNLSQMKICACEYQNLYTFAIKLEFLLQTLKCDNKKFRWIKVINISDPSSCELFRGKRVTRSLGQAIYPSHRLGWNRVADQRESVEKKHHSLRLSPVLRCLSNVIKTILIVFVMTQLWLDTLV